MPKGYEVARIAVRDHKRLRAALPHNARVVALDERGRDYATKQFAELRGRETAFVIGGPDGLDDSIKAEAAILLRLSAMTLPHALAQVILLEQLYRASTLLAGHPYHRE